jgi:hypothetical protein
MRDAVRLLEVLSDAALRQARTSPRPSGLPGIERAVAHLQAREPLTRAIAGLVPPRTAELLAVDLASLSTRAALPAGAAWRRAQQ